MIAIRRVNVKEYGSSRACRFYHLSTYTPHPALNFLIVSTNHIFCARIYHRNVSSLLYSHKIDCLTSRTPANQNVHLTSASLANAFLANSPSPVWLYWTDDTYFVNRHQYLYGQPAPWYRNNNLTFTPYLFHSMTQITDCRATATCLYTR